MHLESELIADEVAQENPHKTKPAVKVISLAVRQLLYIF
jgi:hypothetical protein